MDGLSLQTYHKEGLVIKKGLRKWCFDYRLLPLALQKWYLTQNKRNTDLDIRDKMRNNYLLNNCDNLVRYVSQMVSFDL